MTFQSTLKGANELFNDLQILKIWNENVGHLLTTRENLSLDWNKVANLIQIGCNAHDYVNSQVFKQKNYWYREQKMLNSIFSNNLTNRNLFKTWREMYRNNQDTIEREKIGDLLKMNRP